MTLGQLLALGPSLCLLLPSEQRHTEAASFWETQGSPVGQCWPGDPLGPGRPARDRTAVRMLLPTWASPRHSGSDVPHSLMRSSHTALPILTGVSPGKSSHAASCLNTCFPETRTNSQPCSLGQCQQTQGRNSHACPQSLEI